MTKTLRLQTLTCPSCVAKIERAVSQQPSVDKVEVMFNASKVKVWFDGQLDSMPDIRSVIEDLGYKVLDEK